MMASCLSKLHSDPMFSIALISPLGPQTGSGAVPRTPATPRHSPPLRGRPRDALYYYYLVLQQICCHAFLEEQAWCSMGSSSFFFSSTSILLPGRFHIYGEFPPPCKKQPPGASAVNIKTRRFHIYGEFPPPCMKQPPGRPR